MSAEYKEKISAARLAQYDRTRGINMLHLYNSGFTLAKIAEMYGVKRHIVEYQLARYPDKRPRLDMSGPNSPRWLGDKVGYYSLHSYMHTILTKPDRCEKCGGSDKPIQLANKTGKYLRDPSDWLWLCTTCHHAYDRLGERTHERAVERRKTAAHCKKGHAYKDYGYTVREDGSYACNRCRRINLTRSRAKKITGGTMLENPDQVKVQQLIHWLENARIQVPGRERRKEYISGTTAFTRESICISQTRHAIIKKIYEFWPELELEKDQEKAA